jgi:hypothetical protein
MTPRQLTIYLDQWSKPEDSKKKDVTMEDVEMFNLVAGIPKRLIKKANGLP